MGTSQLTGLVCEEQSVPIAERVHCYGRVASCVVLYIFYVQESLKSTRVVLAKDPACGSGAVAGTFAIQPRKSAIHDP